ncbi:MAG: tetratricopeptide repeat protein [Bacteroidota bacterium]
MSNSRLHQLFEFLKQDPNDAFTLYAIAMEYSNTDTGKALEYYEQLLKEHHDYVATYYHAAKLYADLGRREEAESVFKEGLLIAKKKNKTHAYNELQRAYRAFQDEDE